MTFKAANSHIYKLFYKHVQHVQQLVHVRTNSKQKFRMKIVCTVH